MIGYIVFYFEKCCSDMTKMPYWEIQNSYISNNDYIMYGDSLSFMSVYFKQSESVRYYDVRMNLKKIEGVWDYSQEEPFLGIIDTVNKYVYFKLKFSEQWNKMPDVSNSVVINLRSGKIYVHDDSIHTSFDVLLYSPDYKGFGKFENENTVRF